MLHLPQFGVIRAVTACTFMWDMDNMLNKQQFLGWSEQLLGSYSVFWGCLAGAWKSHRACVLCGQNCSAEDFLTLDGKLSSWQQFMFYCSHYSCQYISICVFVFVQPVRAVARQTTFCSLLFAALWSTFTTLNLLTVISFLCLPSEPLQPAAPRSSPALRK